MRGSVIEKNSIRYKLNPVNEYPDMKHFNARCTGGFVCVCLCVCYKIQSL